MPCLQNGTGVLKRLRQQQGKRGIGGESDAQKKTMCADDRTTINNINSENRVLFFKSSSSGSGSGGGGTGMLRGLDWVGDWLTF